MRLKYYLRGIGIGIIFSTLILAISFYFGKEALVKRGLTDEEIIARAEELGMVMSEGDADTEEVTESEENVDVIEETEVVSEEGDSQDDVADNSDSDEFTGEVSEVLESEEATDMTDKEETESVTYVPFTVHGGESSDTVAYNLYKAGLVDSSDKFNKYMNSLGVDNRIQAGTFYVKQGSTYDDLIALLVNKDTRNTTPPSN